MNKQPLPTSPSKMSPNYIEAPLVHLIDTDPNKLNPAELQAYIEQLRNFRGNAATRKAATEQKPKKGAKQGLDLGGLL